MCVMLYRKYCFGGNLAVREGGRSADGFYRNSTKRITHAFMKTTDKVPKAEITKAKKYRDDFLKRFSKE